jgi:eukaryotic-like serine/threonine-protein kinase
VTRAGDEPIAAACASTVTATDRVSNPRDQVPPGTAIQRYVVLQPIGAGAMATVYAAHDFVLDRRIALKLLHDPGSANQRRRLLREARALARLSHPNVTAVYDAGDWADQIYVAMELVDGCSLRAWLRARRRGWREVVAVMRGAGAGLAAAHAAGVIHRDFKPDNLLVDRNDQARVGDFGVARIDDGDEADDRDLDDGDDAPRVETWDRTASGAAIGTPAYMAPEQRLGSRAIDARADQFSYCLTLWEALYGRRPFTGAVQEGGDESRRALPSLAEPPGRDVPAWLRRLVERGLAHDPDRRHSSMGALLLALDGERSQTAPVGRSARRARVRPRCAGRVRCR